MQFLCVVCKDSELVVMMMVSNCCFCLLPTIAIGWSMGNNNTQQPVD
jgi:hypothetical protein